jgi:tetratricopeptide (TPR) repeat protein
MGERWATLADAVLDRLGPGHDVWRSWVLQNRAVIRMQANDLDGALDLIRQTLALKRRAFGDDSAEVAVSLSTQADVMSRRGDPAAALAIIQQVKDKVIKAYGASNPSLATALGNEGEYLVALGRYAEAQTAFRGSLARWEPEVGPEHQFLAYPLTGMGVAYWKSGHAADAIALLERALAIREAHEPDPATVAETRFALAGALWDSGGDRARARRLAIAALNAYQRPPASDAKAREVTAWLSAHRAR